MTHSAQPLLHYNCNLTMTNQQRQHARYLLIYIGFLCVIGLNTSLHWSHSRQQPQYLAELIRMYETPRQLRPRGANILQCCPATLNFSRNAFCHAAPAVWNKLSETVTSDITVSIATFKSRLKTALYNRVFLRWHCDLSHSRFFTFMNDLTCLKIVL